MRHDFYPRAQFRMLHRAREILQDHAPPRPREAILERLHVLAAATANVHEEHAVLGVCGASVAIEYLLLHREPVGKDGTVLAIGRHEGVKVSGGCGSLFDVVPDVEVRVEGVLEGCSEGIRGAMIAVFLKVCGHLGEILEGMVEAGGELSY